MRRMTDGRFCGLAPAAALLLAGVAGAQPALPMHHELIEPGPQGWTTLYATGERVPVETYTQWKLICGSDDSAITRQEFLQLIDLTKAAAANVEDEGLSTRGGLDLVFSVSGAVPAGAAAALTDVENYIESRFSDPITVTISINFATMSAGILGATGSQFVTNSWNNTRTGLINDMDPTDTIQLSLPSGTTIPVRYNGSSSSASNENAMDATRANHRAAIGTSSGLAASMTINTNVNWDWDPSNGVGSRTCFQSVLVHEVGHALGFVSKADNGTAEMDVLDAYRFQDSDGAGDFNPDTIAEFTTTPRLVDFNNPDDDVNSDIISNEYAMSDGSPWQASHFREQGSNIGIMDPAMSPGQTFYPNFYRSSDLNMLDAIGWDYPPLPPVPVPIPVDDVLAGIENQALIITETELLANDDDPDDDPLQISSFTQPLNGLLVDNGDHTFTYSPALAFVGADHFTYTLTDDDGSGTATVTVNVIPAPTVYRVDPAAAGEGTGLAWVDAITTLDAALAIADEGDELWVAAGTYRPAGPGREASFHVPVGVEVYGGFPPGGGDNTFSARDPNDAAMQTVLSGDLAGNDAAGDRSENAYHVITLLPGPSTLDGLVVTGGVADGFGSEQDRGGGMLIHGGTPTLRGVRFLDNRASFIGGGIFADGPVATITSCSLLGNDAPRGGGAAFSTGSPVFLNLAASGNTGTADGGALYLAGVQAVVANATFVDNLAGGGGGAIAVVANTTLDLRNCIFSENGNGAGGSLSLTSGALVNVDHSIILGGQPGVSVTSATLNWLAGNADAAPRLLNQLGEDGLAGTGDEDFTPGPGSPAIDAGANDAIALTTDIRGQTRRVDALQYEDTGSGESPLVDIGAAEAAADTPAPASCPCEADGNDAQVDVFDLLAYLDLWFVADPGAELTGDEPGSVDVFDLLTFLDCWFPASAGSPCP